MTETTSLSVLGVRMSSSMTSSPTVVAGQYIDWSKLDEATEEFIGWDGVEDDD